MKKTLLLTFLILTLLLASCAPDIVANGGVVVRSSELSPSATVAEYDTVEDIVYVTKSGTKYHKSTCSHLSDSCIPITLDQAIAQGFEPCSHCHPDD